MRSISFVGFLFLFGSLASTGFLGQVGSLRVPGLLLRTGSLHTYGFLWGFGSFLLSLTHRVRALAPLRDRASLLPVLPVPSTLTRDPGRTS